MALLSCIFASAIRAEAMSNGAELYLQECSRCHGRLTAARGVAGGDAARLVAVVRGPSLAFALPYGPSLVGVLGRPAGSVPGYDYSAAFLRAMRDVVWDDDSLDEYLTDTQVRAPGARMYYAQPDAEIRRQIIEYLATTQSN